MNWYARKSSGDQGLIIEEDTGRNVAVTYDEKDAPLIAAAPELLTALTALMGLWDREDVADTWHDEFVKARAAITKATEKIR